jgi:hypothetical protein
MSAETPSPPLCARCRRSLDPAADGNRRIRCPACQRIVWRREGLVFWTLMGVPPLLAFSLGVSESSGGRFQVLICAAT